MLIEALHKSKLGKSVLIIESKSIIGGSWHCFDKKYFSTKIEVGCHIWQKNESVNHFLKKAFSINVEPRNPQPKTIFFGTKLPYYFINLAYIFKRIKRNSNLNLDHLRLYKSLTFDFFNEMFNREKYYYPVGGSSELITKILDKVKDSSVEILTQTEVAEINLSTLSLKTSHQKEIHFKGIIGTNKLDLDNIILTNKKKHPVIKRPSASHNLYFLMKTKYKANLTYIEIHGDNILDRIADMTFDNQNLLDKGLRLICTDIHDDAFKKHDRKKLESLIQSKLHKWKVLTSETEIISSFLNTYPFNAQSNEVTSNYNSAMNPQALFLKSNNLIPSLADNIERWENLIN
jgi:hypothetical protein